MSKYKNCLYKSVEPFTAKKKLHGGITQRYVVSSRRTSNYLLFFIKRNGGNVVHNAIFLHTTALAEKIHFIHLLLILRFQFFLLSGKLDFQLPFLGGEARL